MWFDLFYRYAVSGGEEQWENALGATAAAKTPGIVSLPRSKKDSSKKSEALSKRKKTKSAPSHHHKVKRLKK